MASKRKTRRAKRPTPRQCLLREQLGAHALGELVQNGKGAIKGEHRGKLIEHNGKLTGSLDFDAAARSGARNASRWDYVVGIATAGARQVDAVEVHRATAGEVRALIAKKEWSAPVLAQAGVRVTAWHWLATQSCPSFPPTSTEARLLTKAGITQPKRCLVI